ncbi:MAG: flagellar protein FlgN [Gammaproteobacteria bacterium]
MITDENKRGLSKILRSQITCSGQLVETIQDEQAALARRDINALEAITRIKLELTERIEQLELDRNNLLKSLGYTENPDGMNELLTTLDDASGLKAAWQQVLENIRICRDKNLTNGAVLELGRRQAEYALSILRQQHEPHETYGAEGQKATAFGNRELGKA